MTPSDSHGWHADTVSDSAVQLVARMLDSDAAVSTRTERVTRQLERAIMVGVFAEGDRLPPEAALAEELGVSSITLRQALAELRARGHLSTRRGRGGGSFVSTGRPSTEAQLLADLAARSTGELRELGDFASAIGDGAARCAADRADTDDLTHIRAAASEFALAASAADLRRTDSRFHLALSVAAHSTRLANATLQIHGELAPLMWLSDDHTLEHELSIREHADIIAAVEARDAGTAGALARAHYERAALEALERSLAAWTGEDDADGG